MKTKRTLLLALLITTITFAQNGINYKAIIKDGSGNILASQSVDVQFIIYEGAALTNNVYQESYNTIMTDANGILIVNIGKGTTTDVFADVAWGNDEHWLNVQVDTGAGLLDMGTTQFKAVPYALNATNVNGLEALNEGNGVGWRLIGLDPQYYGPIGQDAVDFSRSIDNAVPYGAVNFASFAAGSHTSAQGFYSTAMGDATLASGNASTAMGQATRAQAFASLAIGRYNVGGGTTDSWMPTDPLFEVGNGSGPGNLTNALSIFKNGTIIAPTFDMAQITDNKALITKEYADNNYNSTGLEALNEGNGNGWRLVGVNPNQYGNLGQKAVDLSHSNTNSTTQGATGINSIAMGLASTASGDYSTAMGLSSTASGHRSTSMGSSTQAGGDFSTAMGSLTSASGTYSMANGLSTIAGGDYSTAIGNNSNASGDSSTAMGNNSSASGDSSTAMGFFTRAPSQGETAIGSYNTLYTLGINGDTQWNSTDRLFVIGNGTNAGNRSNALTVLKNGNIGISTDTPTTKLHITDGGDADLTNGSGYFLMGEENGINIVMDNNEIMARNNGGNSTLFFQIDGGAVNVGDELLIGGDVKVNGILVHASDRRLKKDFETIPYGLEEVLQFKPMAYNWKNRDSDHKSLGLIAQDVQKIIEGLVVNNESNNRLAVNYTELIPVLIKALQEQQDIIDNQNAKIEAQETVTAQQNATIESLGQRMNALEAANN